MTPQGTRTDSLGRLVDLVNHSRDGLSSIRHVTSGLLRIINDPDSSAKDLKELIEIDPPLTAKVLRLANSAYYSPGRRIGEIGQAIITIGFNAVKELALSQKVCEIFDRDEQIAGYSRVLLWRHTVSVALLSKLICRRELGQRGDGAYAAGILHDMGLIVEDQFLQKEFRSILRRTIIEEGNLPGAERQVLGYTHAEIARAIARDWNFPGELSMALGCHHQPDRAEPAAARMAAVLYLAECLSARRGIGYADGPCVDDGLLDRCVRELGVDASGLDLIVEEAQSEVARMESQGLLI